MDTPKKLIDDLVQNHALSDSEIARRIHTSQPTIWRIRNEQVSDCSSSVYIALVHLRDELRSETAC